MVRISYTTLYTIAYTTLYTALEHALHTKSVALTGAADIKMATLAHYTVHFGLWLLLEFLVFYLYSKTK
ncbi:hypothetical protein Y032_0506g2681 [Ancylostoma ceylanicum]|uniref:Uncharacterized protein n=1 Tax=Ancylostoma ceylanicum TaxID=53326 RepID=A0A016WUX1_9BILA|nr:hypothetical protein Y032_0506g2681 [Ancylostoma ceylanicum]